MVGSPILAASTPCSLDLVNYTPTVRKRPPAFIKLQHLWALKSNNWWLDWVPYMTFLPTTTARSSNIKNNLSSRGDFPFSASVLAPTQWSRRQPTPANKTLAVEPRCSHRLNPGGLGSSQRRLTPTKVAKAERVQAVYDAKENVDVAAVAIVRHEAPAEANQITEATTAEA